MVDVFVIISKNANMLNFHAHIGALLKNVFTYIFTYKALVSIESVFQISNKIAYENELSEDFDVTYLN